MKCSGLRDFWGNILYCMRMRSIKSIIKRFATLEYAVSGSLTVAVTIALVTCISFNAKQHTSFSDTSNNRKSGVQSQTYSQNGTIAGAQVVNDSGNPSSSSA